MEDKMNVVEELKRKLENADSDEIRVLEQTEEPVVLVSASG